MNTIDALVEALEASLAVIERADCSTGYCCCGSSMDSHTFGDGHNPVDQGWHIATGVMEEARAALAIARAEPQSEALTDEEIERLWVDLPTWGDGQPWHIRFVRAIEAAHNAKLSK